jgi:membrane protein
VTGVVQGVDRWQRRFPPVAFPLGVLYKFFDDQGNYLAAVVTYYAFIAIFPLLLLGTSILGFFLQGNAGLQQQLLDSALAQFPIIGEQLGREGIHGSTGGVVVGTIAALYGAMGLGQAIQNTVNTAWSVPRNSRPNPFLLRLRSLVLLATGGVAVLGVSVMSTVANNTKVFGGHFNGGLRMLVTVASVCIVAAMLTLLFRLATTREHALRHAMPGAVTLALLWQALQVVGAWYVQHALTSHNQMNATFALVLGLVGFIYLFAVAGVLGIEVNVVIARKLWPRALLTPFTDAVDLTEADRRAYAGYALMQRHKGFETVAVTFDGRDGNTHEIVMDPTWLQKTRRIRRVNVPLDERQHEVAPEQTGPHRELPRDIPRRPQTSQAPDPTAGPSADDETQIRHRPD